MKASRMVSAWRASAAAKRVLDSCAVSGGGCRAASDAGDAAVPPAAAGFSRELHMNRVI